MIVAFLSCPAASASTVQSFGPSYPGFGVTYLNETSWTHCGPGGGKALVSAVPGFNLTSGTFRLGVNASARVTPACPRAQVASANAEEDLTLLSQMFNSSGTGLADVRANWTINLQLAVSSTAVGASNNVSVSAILAIYVTLIDNVTGITWGGLAYQNILSPAYANGTYLRSVNRTVSTPIIADLTAGDSYVLQIEIVGHVHCQARKGYIGTAMLSIGGPHFPGRLQSVVIQ